MRYRRSAKAAKPTGPAISTGEKETIVSNRKFVGFSKKHLDPRGGGGHSKAKTIWDFLASSSHKAFYSTDIAQSLSGAGVKVRDVMACARRLEARGLVYVRGYRAHERQTPFAEGYLLTWIDTEKPREKAIEEAVQRTDAALEGRAATSPIIERVRRIRDIVLAATKSRDIVAQSYLAGELRCSTHELDGAIQRVLQLYPDLKELKLFNNYRYFYHASMSAEDLQAAVTMKENYIRVEKGRDNRGGKSDARTRTELGSSADSLPPIFKIITLPFVQRVLPSYTVCDPDRDGDLRTLRENINIQKTLCVRGPQ